MTFRVSWNDDRSGERRTRNFELADEARGFIRGLRVHPGHTQIAVRRIAEDGQMVKLKVAELFGPSTPEAPPVVVSDAVEPDGSAAGPSEEPESATLAAVATALVDEAAIAEPIAEALAVVEAAPAESEPPVVQAASAPANDPHPAPQPVARPAGQSQAASMLAMAKRWM